ncbi:MAG: alanine racemase [Flavobacteriales bacterium]
MKLALSYHELAQLTEGVLSGEPSIGLLQEVAYDTRKINPSANSAFFALHGPFRDGHSYISEAYEKGVRVFVVQKIPVHTWTDVGFIVVDDVLDALQKLAMKYRDSLTYPILAIAGSLGKTTVKEWMYHLLSGKLQVYRSPKSYNSQLGVALSLLQLPRHADLALIEVAATKPGEMQKLAKMVKPTHGILTNLLPSHSLQFLDFDSYRAEIMSIFENVQQLSDSKGLSEQNQDERFRKSLIPFHDETSVILAQLAILAAQQWTNVENERIQTLPQLAMRLETFEGHNGSLIINDTYTMDQEAFKSSLSYQLSISASKHRVVLIGLTPEFSAMKEAFLQMCQEFGVDEVHFLAPEDEFNVQINNATVLIKGARFMQRIANRLKRKKHKTQLTYHLSALKHNLGQFKSMLNVETKMLAMVKAQSYGAGLTTLAKFLEKQGVHYFGVAYSDEGRELREAGIQTPILVMNTEEEGMETCVIHQLEPAIYDFHQLDELLKVLIAQEITAFPIHIKIDTGMKRLGFHPDELQALIEILSAQPEVIVKSIYSHLADADQVDASFTQQQLSIFEKACAQFEAHLSYPFFRHILNSEGIANHSETQLDLVRIGIGLFGISSNDTMAKRLKPVIQWSSSISQIKIVRKGESVGYGRSFVANHDMRIAIVPIGYADGFKRSLSNGAGAVYIQNQRCAVVGKVCMDMIMIDLGDVPVDVHTQVEIIGQNQTLEAFAESCQTIPYEILTSISTRVHRSYSEEE